MTVIRLIIYGVLIILFMPGLSDSQTKYDRKKLAEEISSNINAFFLSANRPSYSVSAGVVGKNKYSFSLGVSKDEELINVPFSFNYGIYKKLELSINFQGYTQSYNFNGNKIQGFGDIGIGLKYQFSETEKFLHAVQTFIKIPTANKNNGLGTGKVDFHFGLAELYVYKKFGYELSAELNFLHRRDIPTTQAGIPLIIKEKLDSIKKSYDYKYEPEIVFDGGPFLDITDNFGIYTGAIYSRNIKLKYDLASIYAGMSYLIKNKVNLGFSFSYGVLNAVGYSIYLGLGVSP